MPYGGRDKKDIIRLTETALQPILNNTCECIVIACNTATAAAIEYLRASYPNEKFVGLEPMLKPAAALTQTSTIAICATLYTLSSERYINLKYEYAKDITVIEPDCSTWAEIIESDTLDEQHIKNTIQSILAAKADVIVLACTHYHWRVASLLSR